MKLPYLDYLNISKQFSDEEKLALKTAYDFSIHEINPIIQNAFKTSSFPLKIVKKMGELGLLGITLPKSYGCANMSPITYGLVCYALEAIDSSIRSFLSVQSSLVMYPIYKYGTKEQKEKWLPELAKGDSIGCFGLTEPDFGSNPSGMRTIAKKVKGGFLINGTKMWITNGTIANIAIIWAKYENRVCGFIVETNTKGFSATQMKNKWSLKASDTAELVLKNVFVPSKNLLNDAKGLKAPLQCLSEARYGIGWGAIGLAANVYHVALTYSKERIQFNKPIASFQLTQKKLVWMLNEISKAQSIAFHIGKQKESLECKHQSISLLKRNNVWIARECTKIAREILGANGISGEYPIMRHMMNVESIYTYEGTHDIHTLILGQDITGINAIE